MFNHDLNQNFKIVHAVDIYRHSGFFKHGQGVILEKNRYSALWLEWNGICCTWEAQTAVKWKWPSVWKGPGNKIKCRILWKETLPNHSNLKMHFNKYNKQLITFCPELMASWISFVQQTCETQSTAWPGQDGTELIVKSLGYALIASPITRNGPQQGQRLELPGLLAQFTSWMAVKLIK